MRLRPDALLLACLTLLALLMQVNGVFAQSHSIDASPGSPAITNALDTVKADPNLAPSRTTRMLLWRGSETQPQSPPAWARLVAAAARWIAESGRLLIWAAAILAALLLAVYLLRTSWGRAPEIGQFSPVVPTHVRELDIRPESLPADIGGEALILWENGDRRSAVGLLYRGLLSRLVHRHHIPIRDSSTEGDCLQLARASAPPLSAEYASRVVSVWQRFVYGHMTPEDVVVRGLCADFDLSLTPALPSVSTQEAV